MDQEKSIWTGIRRGLARRCPTCGKGRLFAGYLAIRAPCEVCGVDNNIYPSDDLPPYLTILVSGHVVVPLYIVLSGGSSLPLWIEAAIWLPIALALCLALLPVMKGVAVGLCWATNIVRQDVTT